MSQIRLDVAAGTFQAEPPRGPIEIDPQLVRPLAHAPLHPLHPHGDLRPWLNGELAGAQLAWLYSLERAGVQGASRRMAKHVLEWVFDYHGLPGAQTTFDNAWRSHGSVAHLWAAFILREKQIREFPSLICRGVDHGDKADFARFLREAEVLQEFMLSYKPTRTTRLLGSGNSSGRQSVWLVPSGRHEVEWHPNFPPPNHRAFRITEKIRDFLNKFPNQPPQKKLGRPKREVVQKKPNDLTGAATSA
jgi:hypothetical protein